LEELIRQVQEMLKGEEGKRTVSALMETLGAGMDHPSSEDAAKASTVSPEMLSILGALSHPADTENDDTALLDALRPHLSPKRQQKLDRVLQLMRVSALFPLIQQSGLLERWFHFAEQDSRN